MISAICFLISVADAGQSSVLFWFRGLLQSFCATPEFGRIRWNYRCSWENKRFCWIITKAVRSCRAFYETIRERTCKFTGDSIFFLFHTILSTLQQVLPSWCLFNICKPKAIFVKIIKHLQANSYFHESCLVTSIRFEGAPYFLQGIGPLVSPE